uniref:Conotoxin n=1 Tax=Conus ermineus TaxID=55423 RepID=A0A346CIV6_CONER|nr:conotoxin precursor superfamily T [Conus ermineus]
MRCLPVFIILLLLIASAPSVDVQRKTRNSMTRASLRNFEKKSIEVLKEKGPCCFSNPYCCNLR